MTNKKRNSTRSNQATRIGVVSINPSIENPGSIPFLRLYEAIGLNTGNLMFTEAMFNVLVGDAKQIGFSFDPKNVNINFDVVVVPAANWLNKTADWDWLIERLEALRIPVVVFGIGLQADTTDISTVVVSDSAMRLAQFFSRSASKISVRGNFTKSWLESIGIENAVTTGCPSLYMNIFDTDETILGSDLIFQSTRYGISEPFTKTVGINRKLFSHCAEFGMPMIYQSEPEEIELLVYGAGLSSLEMPKYRLLTQLYNVKDSHTLVSFLQKNGHVFFNLPNWSSFVRSCTGVIGTRLHGSIIALNSGRPAVLIPHDSRTAEVASFAGIPVAHGPAVRDMHSIDDLRSLLASADLVKYKDVRSKNQAAFIDFLNDVGLAARTDRMF